MNWRLILLLGILSVIAVAGLANALHVRQLRADLSEVADKKVAEFRAESIQHEEANPRIATAVVVAKSNVFFGDISGKVSVYIQHGGHGETARVEGFEFMYARESTGWRQTESGRCSSDECTAEGLRLLRRLDQH